MRRIRALLAALGMIFAALMAFAPPAAADNCDIFINPEDCQNTGWTVGTIATLAGGVAVATAAVSVRTQRKDETGTDEPVVPVRPPAQQEKRTSPGDVDVRPEAAPPEISVEPSGGNMRGHSVRLQVHFDPGHQEVVDRGRD